jgi:serine/threonine protein kinase
VLALGSVVAERYELVASIGIGGMSEVFRAVDRVSGDDVAVKVLRGVDASFHHRFAREAKVLMRLDDPAIVRLRAEGVDHGSPYLVLDLVDGPSLAERLAAGPLPEEDVAGIGAWVAGALAHAHAEGIVHRDVKPGNVLLASTGQPMLVDFGIAVVGDTTSVTAAGTVIGTASYLAPEQLREGGTVPESDVYSLGLVLIEAVQGAKAFPGTAAEAAGARLVGPPVVPATVSPWFASVLTAMPQLAPAARPSASAVATALRDRAPLAFADPDRTVVAEPTTVLPVAALAPLAPSPRRRRVAALLVAAAALAAALVGGVLALDSRSNETPPVQAVTTTAVSIVTTAPTTTEPPTTTIAPKPPKKGKGSQGDG